MNNSVKVQKKMVTKKGYPVNSPLNRKAIRNPIDDTLTL